MRLARQFTPQEVAFIRDAPWRVRQLARFFGCNAGAVSNIRRGLTYKDI